MSGPLRLVVFDVDGTLVDSQSDIIVGMRTAFASLDLKPPATAAILETVGLSLFETMRRLAPDSDRAIQCDLVTAYKQAYAKLRQSAGSTSSSPLYAHVHGVLRDLHDQPHTLLGIATGKSRRGLNLLVDGHSLRSLFVTMQCADDHPSKPHPSMLHATMADTGVLPENTVMVGDTSFDIDMARAAGAIPIGVSWGYQSRDRLNGARAILDDIRDLPSLLETIWKCAA